MIDNEVRQTPIPLHVTHPHPTQVTALSWLKIPSEKYAVISSLSKISSCQLEVTVEWVQFTFLCIPLLKTKNVVKRTFWYVIQLTTGRNSPPYEYWASTSSATYQPRKASRTPKPNQWYRLEIWSHNMVCNIIRIQLLYWPSPFHQVKPPHLFARYSLWDHAHRYPEQKFYHLMRKRIC